MSYSYTRTESWSHTHARKVAGKVAADLRRLQQEYGQPSDSMIEEFLLELTILLTGGYVAEVSYGFDKYGTWIAALNYVADMSGNLDTNDRAGRIPRGTDVSDARFYSYLVFSDKWKTLSPAERLKIEAQLPFVREGAPAPSVGAGGWRSDKCYSSAGCGLRRGAVGGFLAECAGKGALTPTLGPSPRRTSTSPPGSWRMC